MKKNQILNQLWELLCDFIIKTDTPATIDKSLPPSDLDVPIMKKSQIIDESKKKSIENEKKQVVSNKEKLERLKVIRKFASWNGDAGTIKLNAAIEFFKEEFPECNDELEKMITQGKEDKKLFDKAYKLGGQGAKEIEIGKLSENISDEILKPIKHKIYKQYENGKKANQRWKRENKKKKAEKKLSNVKVRKSTFKQTVFSDLKIKKPNKINNVSKKEFHPNDIRALNPCSKWTLVIDETGSLFDESSTGIRKSKLGRFVGVLIPDCENSLLPMQKKWHAVECSDTDEIDKVVQNILDTETGVFGIDVNSLPITPGERWMDGVALLIDWVLRLIPVDKLCELDVKIEQRGEFKAGISWDLVKRNSLRQLALTFPKRAMNIDLKISTITKNGSPFNGYADAIAFTWAQTTESSQERLKNSGLNGTCLLNSIDGADSRSFLNIWDSFAQGVHLPPTIWWDILSAPNSNNPVALINSFLKTVGNEIKELPENWHLYLNETKRQMAMSPINLKKLASAVDWLQLYQPSKTEMLPTLRMAWLTVKLANANHLGKAEKIWQNELKVSGDILIDEVAPLVCHSDLHRAVAATNRFDFEGARESLNRWNNRPPAEPGLCYWGQLRSSLGQHSAFLGDNTKAISFFEEALSAFSRLSDPEIRKLNKSQTNCYLAIAMMDSPNIENDKVRKFLENIFGSLPKAAENFTTNCETNNTNRYLHHLLLRWLVFRQDNEDIKQIYIKNRKEWKVDKGHPWQLIQLYRAFLLKETNQEKARELAVEAAGIAFADNQGPTVRLIGACCYIIAASWGFNWLKAKEELDKLEKELPKAKDRVIILRDALVKPVPPIDILNSVLPFNFK